MELRLPFPPEPHYMADLATVLVQAVKRIDGEDLGYDTASLDIVDRLLGRFHDNGDDPSRIAETLFLFGAYVGEVAVRQAGGTWVTLPDDHPLGGGWPVVQLAEDRFVNPIGRAFKRASDGEVESIPSFYRTLVVRR